MTPERLKEIAAQLLSIAEELDSHEPTISEKKKYCAGCYNNCYNGELAERCWNLKEAKIVQRKFVHIDDVPPWTTQTAETTLSCHHRQKYISVRPEQTH
jgi:hypothetical protein